MKNIFSLLLFILSFAPSFAQKLTDKQIEGYLEALKKEEIITEFGKDTYLKIINKEDKTFQQRFGSIHAISQFTKNQVPESLFKSRTSILGFLGVFELMRNIGSGADELVRLRELSEKMLGDNMFFKTEIEGDIKLNNPFSFLVIEQNLRPSKDKYRELATKLKAINLIDEKVYDELIVWLKKDQIKIIKDFGFFVYAARQTYFYDNYTALKATQFSLIDSLQHKNMLSISDANNIKNSYKQYDLKSKVEILSYCKNVILIPAEQKYLTRSEIYESYWKEIKQKLIPNFDFRDIQLSEISKKEESFYPNESNIPIKNPFAGRLNKFKMSYQVNNKAYTQKADTDFSLIKTIKNVIPHYIDIDSSIIQSYAAAFSFLTGFTSKDFQSINDFLTDQHSSKRVIVVGNDYNPFLALRDGRKALLLVDSSQNVLFEEKNRINSIFGGLLETKIDFTSNKSRDSLYLLIEEFQKIGLIPTADGSNIENVIVELRFEPKNASFIKRNLLSQFSEVIAKVNPIPIKESEQILMFKNFVTSLEKISRGIFKAEKISDNFETEIKKSPKKERELVVSFKLNGKKYESKNKIAKADEQDINSIENVSLNFSMLFFNTQEWLEEINRALEENQINGKFFKINVRKASTYGGTENYIFLTKKQSEYIKEKHGEILNDPEIPIGYKEYRQQVAAFNVENFTKALKREKMLAEDAIKDLKTTKEPSDILIESKQAVVVDLNELAEKSNTELYSYILQKLNSKLLPKTKFSEIKYLRDNTDNSETDFEKQNISAFIDGKSYQQTLYVSLKHIISSNLDSLKKENSTYFPSIGENQFKIVNDYLTDIASPYRLVIVCDYRSPKLSFVLFDSTQVNIVEETLPNNAIDFKMYDTKNSRDSLGTLLDKLTQIELIEKMSNQEQEDFIVNLRKFPINGLSILENLKNVTIQCNIWNVESYQDIYISLIDSLSKISWNQFKPTHLNDNFAKTLKKSNYSDRTFRYGFTMPNGKKYQEKQFVEALAKPKSKQEKLTYELFDFDTAKLIDLVNRAISENYVADAMFYQIYSDEDIEESIGPRFIFLNSKQYRWLKIKFPEIFETFDNEPDNDIDERKEEK
jgi:hypothetical protein